MAIQIQAIRDRLSRALGAGGPSFEGLFVLALNDTISQFNTYCNREIDYVENSEGTLDLDQRHTQTFYFGCLFYLERSGEWAREPLEKTEYLYKKALANSQFECITDDDLPAGREEGDWGGSS